MFQFPNRKLLEYKYFQEIVKKMEITPGMLEDSYKYWIYPWCIFATKDILNKDSMILEAAPGGKHFILKYLSDEIGCKIYATDLVKRKRKLNVVNNLNYTQGDLTKTVYKSNFFDVVYCISVVEHMTEKVRKEYYNEVVRILKPGGKLILSTLEDQKIFGEGPNEAILAGDIYFIPKETFKNIPGLKLEKTGDYLKHPEFNDESIFWQRGKNKIWTEYCVILTKI